MREMLLKVRMFQIADVLPNYIRSSKEKSTDRVLRGKLKMPSAGGTLKILYGAVTT